MLANHCEFDFTKRIVRPDGSIRYVRWVGVPVTEGVTFEGFVGTGIDVTEQELLEQERERLRQLETDLAHTNRVSMWGNARLFWRTKSSSPSLPPSSAPTAALNGSRMNRQS